MSNSLQKQLFLHKFKKAEAHLGLSVGEDDDEGKDGLGAVSYTHLDVYKRQYIKNIIMVN